MKRRSISGFVTGLVGILIGIPTGFYAYIILALLLGLGGFDVLAYSIYLFYVAGIVAIVGICFYFVKARIGAILMLLAAILYLVPFICGLYAVISSNESLIELMVALVIGNIPTILLLVSAILGFCAKAKPTISPETTEQVTNN